MHNIGAIHIINKEVTTAIIKANITQCVLDQFANLFFAFVLVFLIDVGRNGVGFVNPVFDVFIEALSRSELFVFNLSDQLFNLVFRKSTLTFNDTLT